MDREGREGGRERARERDRGRVNFFFLTWLIASSTTRAQFTSKPTQELWRRETDRWRVPSVSAWSRTNKATELQRKRSLQKVTDTTDRSLGTCTTRKIPNLDVQVTPALRGWGVLGQRNVDRGALSLSWDNPFRAVEKTSPFIQFHSFRTLLPTRHDGEELTKAPPLSFWLRTL